MTTTIVVTQYCVWVNMPWGIFSMLSDPRRLTRWTIAFVCLWLLGSLGQTGLYLWQINLLGGFGGSAATPAAVARAVEATDPVQMPFLLIGLLFHVAFLRRVYVTNRNAQQWSDSMSINPGWNVGWFFVPVASLWMPFRGICETRGASIDPDAPGAVPAPTWLWIWWGLWIAMSAYGNVTGVILNVTNTPSPSLPAIWTQIAGLGIDVPLAVLTCRLLSDVATLQSRHIDLSASHTRAGHEPLPQA